jgi:hypothetical protein
VAELAGAVRVAEADRGHLLEHEGEVVDVQVGVGGDFETATLSESPRTPTDLPAFVIA